MVEEQPRKEQQQNTEPAPRPTLCITEKWIRERLNLQLDSLESVRSLALPGSYSDKITDLGRSLLGFTKLMHLDLSRNAVESLQGLEQLKQLETLNLYYNNISSLKEIFLLRHNSKLKELDLRLNPVTCNEPDYRLFLIHMLTHLCKLDERGVVDSERRAALMHFNTDQAHQMEEGVKNRHHIVALPPDDSKHMRPRTRMVQSLAPHSALQDNTDELLELIRRSDCLVTPVKYCSTTTPHSSSASYTQHMHATTPSSAGPRKGSAKRESNGRVRLGFQDEAEAYSDFKVNVNFTPAPEATCSSEAAPTADAQEREQKVKGEGDGERNEISATTLTLLVDLLQQYVSADISFLTRDARFKGALCELWEQTGRQGDSKTERLRDELTTLRQQLHVEHATLKNRDTQLASLREKLSQCECEASTLGTRLLEQSSELQQLRQDAGLREEMTQLLQHANSDISSLQEQVHSLQEENVLVKTVLDKAPKTVHLMHLKKKMGQLESEKVSLATELSRVRQKQHREAHSHAQLASMLQESHRSLVATNDHLLKELEVTKLKHSQEIAQMHQNYQHLKKTLNIVHTT